MDIGMMVMAVMYVITVMTPSNDPEYGCIWGHFRGLFWGHDPFLAPFSGVPTPQTPEMRGHFGPFDLGFVENWPILGGHLEGVI